jgi:hypothetical protein
VQGLLRPENLPAKADPALFEMAFVFACVWAFGGALCEKDGVKYRQAFDKWWKVGGCAVGAVTLQHITAAHSTAQHSMRFHLSFS